MISEALGLTYKAQSDEEKLLEYLFQDYNPSARPVLNSSNTVKVNLQFSLLQIQELVSVEFVLSNLYIQLDAPQSRSVISTSA